MERIETILAWIAGGSDIIANLSLAILFLASVSPKDLWDYVEALVIRIP